MAPPTRTLAPHEEGAYLARLCSALRAARLNAQYPPSRAARAHLRCMGADVHGGLYAPVQIDLRSGLPTYREWIRVLTDAGVAGSALAELPPPEVLRARAEADPSAVHAKRWLKSAYYRAVLAQPLLQIDRMSVALRRVDAAARTGYFTVVLDKLEASGCLIRYSVELAQRDAFFRRPILELDDRTIAHTEEFQSLVFRFASIDAELTFARLAEHGHVVVERVTRGSIGPFFATGGLAPPSLAALLAHPSDFVATFSLDVAARDLAQDRDNDPLETWLGDRLSPEARAEYERARARFGYRVFKDRKFVVSPALADAIFALCRDRGTRNVVYVMA